MGAVGGHSGHRSTVLGMLQLPGSDFTQSSLPRGSPRTGRGCGDRHQALGSSKGPDMNSDPISLGKHTHPYTCGKLNDHTAETD